MPITFESIQDPFGIRGAGSILAQALMQQGQENRQEQGLIRQEQRADQRTLDAERRAQALKQQFGNLLGSALSIAQDPASPLQAKLGALQQYVSQTGDTSVLPMMKQIGEQGQIQQTLEQFGLGQPSQAQGQLSSQQPSPQQQFPGIGKPTAQPQQQPQTQKKTLADFSNEELIKMSASGNKTLKAISDAEFKRRDLEQKQFLEDRKYHEKGSKDAEQEASSLRSSIPRQRMALQMAREAIQSREVGAFSLNNLAERLGIRELQTAQGAKLVTAGKEFLIGNLSKVSAKAQNQWLEQRFNSMFPEIGKSQTANETIDAMLNAEIKMNEAWLSNYDRLEKEDMEKEGFVRRDISQRAHAASQSQYDQIMNETSYKTRQIYEQEKGVKWLQQNVLKKVPKGTFLTPLSAKIMKDHFGGDVQKAIENAKKLGYKIPTKEEATEWQ
jgi:hypothetical protein